MNHKLKKSRTKRHDIERLRGAVALLRDTKNLKLLKVLLNDSTFQFSKSFVKNAVLKGYINQEEKEKLFQNNMVKLSNGKIASSEAKAFWVAYPNFYEKIRKEIETRSAFLKAHGYELKWRISKIEN